MLIEAKIRDLSEQIANCKDDSEALKLAQELQALLHEQIERLRKKLSLTLPQRKVISFPVRD